MIFNIDNIFFVQISTVSPPRITEVCSNISSFLTENGFHCSMVFPQMGILSVGMDLDHAYDEGFDELFEEKEIRSTGDYICSSWHISDNRSLNCNLTLVEFQTAEIAQLVHKCIGGQYNQNKGIIFDIPLNYYLIDAASNYYGGTD